MGTFALNSPDVIYETFDEEIVAVNLETGDYYSITGSGPRIWIDLVSGYPISEIVLRVLDRHTGDADTIAASVSTFAAELEKNNLLVASTASIPRPTKISESSLQKTPYSAPLIKCFADMRDLLMLDPIHDVDDAGWPMPKNNP